MSRYLKSIQNYTQLDYKGHPEYTFATGIQNGLHVIVIEQNAYTNGSKILQQNQDYFTYDTKSKCTNWRDAKNVKTRIKRLEDQIGQPASFYLNKNAPNNLKGIYIHPKLVPDLLSWASDDFYFYTTDILEAVNDLECEVEEKKNSLNEKDQLLEEKNREILSYIKKYVKRRERKIYPKTNVVYIITTNYMKSDRIYKIGITKDLTARLSTYNSLDECEVIFYQECLTERIMNLAETIIFDKLEDFRICGNREKFTLPETKTVDFFIDVVKEVINSVSLLTKKVEV